MRARARVCAAAGAVALVVALAGAGAGAPDEPAEAPPPAALTIKERLSGKASDDQRVDNCKVPVERHGPKPRPDACGRAAGAARDGRATPAPRE